MSGRRIATTDQARTTIYPYSVPRTVSVSVSMHSSWATKRDSSTITAVWSRNLMPFLRNAELPRASSAWASGVAAKVSGRGKKYLCPTARDGGKRDLLMATDCSCASSSFLCSSNLDNEESPSPKEFDICLQQKCCINYGAFTVRHLGSESLHPLRAVSALINGSGGGMSRAFAWWPMSWSPVLPACKIDDIYDIDNCRIWRWAGRSDILYVYVRHKA